MLLFQTINLDDEVDDVVHELVIPHDQDLHTRNSYICDEDHILQEFLL